MWRNELGFERVQTSRLFEEVTGQIRQMIASGELKLGQRLPPEREFAAILGVSRSSVREALRALEIAGLVKLLKGGAGGAFIASDSADAVQTAMQDMFHVGTLTPLQLTEARLWIEGVVVRVAVERFTEDDCRGLAENVVAAEVAYAEGEFELCARIDFEFHNILAQVTRNPILIANVKGLINVMQQYVGIIGPPQSKYVRKSRQRFMSYLQERNALLAGAEMEELLHRAHRYYLSQISNITADKRPVKQLVNGKVRGAQI